MAGTHPTGMHSCIIMFLHLSVILFTRRGEGGGLCPGKFLYGGGSCPRWSLSRGVSVQVVSGGGVFVQVVSVQGEGSLSRWSLSRGRGLCPVGERGLCPGGLFLGEGSLSSWSLSGEDVSVQVVSVQGDLVSVRGEGSLSRGVSVRDPSPPYGYVWSHRGGGPLGRCPVLPILPNISLIG